MEGDMEGIMEVDMVEIQDTFLKLRSTQGFYLNHVLPPRPKL